MNRLLITALALGLAVTTGVASAQAYDDEPPYEQAPADRYDHSDGYQYDYARVLRVDPVFDDEYEPGPVSGQRCYERPAYVDDNDPYYRDGYYEPYGPYRYSAGTPAGGAAATVIGGVVGAVIGHQFGGGSGRFATTAIGSMVGSVAGREIYEQGQRERAGVVRVCDPVPSSDSDYPDDRVVDEYDVTYEYAGRSYTTRTHYHPGDRIRVRVDVQPE